MPANKVSNDRLIPRVAAVLFALRILVGWHFLYEGLAKLFSPAWSSAGFLIESTWFFSGFFRWIASDAGILTIVDYLNIFGLILVGLALFLGVMVRAASLAGILLLALYYIAQPPLIGLESTAFAEGSYLLVNKNLIEMAVLALFLVLPARVLPGLDWLLPVAQGRRQSVPEPSLELAPEDNLSGASLAGPVGRRELIKSMAALPFFGIFVLTVLKKKSYEEQQLKAYRGADAVSSASARSIRVARLSELKEKVPSGKIGLHQISRIIGGGNLISGFAHARDLIYVSPLLKTYFSDEKVIETLRLCEACGINTVVFRTDENTIRVLSKYWRRGGTIQWLAQVYPKPEDMTGNIRSAVDNGAIGALIQGGIADRWVEAGRVDLLAQSLDFIKGHGLIAGTAAHSLAVPMECEKAGVEIDFYMKTLHHDTYWSAHPVENRTDQSIVGENQPAHDHFHDNMWCMNPAETVDFMARVKKPWIAYKVLAAGAIHPKDGLRYVFESGADFACVGMFDFQVVENANLASEILKDSAKRQRMWFA
jgi:uncharacterized membrane protein YphA (DoxX/SURF4 family)